MDPVTALSLVASVVQLIDATTKAIGFLNDVRNAPKERARLAQEATSLLALLTNLRYMLEDANTTEPWFRGILTLGVENGPLDQFKNAMEEMAGKICPETGVKKLGKMLIWTLERNEIKEILSKIERMKTFVELTLQKDHVALSLAIKADIAEVHKHVLKVGENLGKVRDDVLVISDGVTELRFSQKDRDAQAVEERLVGEHQAAIAWLSHLNFASKQNDTFIRRQDGTGNWFLEKEVVKSWLDGVKQTLWCPGIPGAGKTVLTSIIVDYLERSFPQEDVAVICIYCNYKEQEDQTTTNLIASLLQQLLQTKKVLFDRVMALYKHHMNKRTRPTLHELSSLLHAVAKCFSRIFIVVDALDEITETVMTRESFLVEIRELQSIHPTTSLMVTSRHSTYIEREFEGADSCEISASDEDIKRYLTTQISHGGRLARHVKNDSNLQNAILNTLVKNARGMFLLAQLHLESLAKKHSVKDVRLALKELPEKLNDTYHEAMQRIYDQDRDDVQLAKRVLSWISYASRPISVVELQHALAVEPGRSNLDEDAIPPEDFLISVCAGLVTIDQESRIIRLVHYSAQEFLERIRATTFPAAPTEITLICLAYLSFDVFASGHCASNQELTSRIQENPLLGYAAIYWGNHARGSPEQNEMVQRGIQILFEQKLKLSASIQIMYLGEPCDNMSIYKREVPKNVQGLHLAAGFGLTTITTMLLQQGVNVEMKDNFGATPLHWAAEHNRYDTVLLLLEHGANIDTTDRHALTALHKAAEEGHERMVQMLVEKGADTNPQSVSKETALHVAAQHEYEGVAQHLFEKAAALDRRGSKQWTALHVAAARGAEPIVQLLLKHGADNTAKDQHGETALYKAVRRGHVAVVHLLLEADRKDDETALVYSPCHLPLELALENEHEAVVRLLLREAHRRSDSQSGVEALHYLVIAGDEAKVLLLLKSGLSEIAINSKCYGWTPLITAVRCGRNAIIQLLLDAGVNLEIGANEEGTALHAAVQGGNDAEVQLLLQGGASVNAKDRSGRTALHQSAERKHEAVMQVLLDSDANIEAKDIEGLTVLHLAASLGHDVLLQMLLKHDADINVRSMEQHTPLHLAVLNRHETVICLLLENGADINARSTARHTALHLAVLSGHETVICLLLENGADITARAPNGKTVLHLAVQRNNKRVLQLLLNQRLDTEVKEKKMARTALHMAAVSGRNDLVELLVHNGADMEAVDRYGNTVTAVLRSLEEVRAQNLLF